MNRVTSNRAVGILLVAAFAAGCADHPVGVSGDPGADVRNKNLQANQRLNALETAWADAAANPDKLAIARDASKDTLWKGSAPQILRQRALALLLTDESPEGLADTRKFLRLRLPTETQWPVVTDMCRAIEVVQPLVWLPTSSIM